MSRLLFDQLIEDNHRRRWLNSPVSVYQGTLDEIEQYMPCFERRSFALTQPDAICSRLNQHFDTIVRKPFRDDRNYIPVGIVSKNYALVPHKEVLDAGAKALQQAKISPEKVKAELTITEYGERMRVCLYLPDEYSFDPGDGNVMAMRLECFNSVDGSTRFQALLGWFRFVCSNGLIVGVTKLGLRHRHIGHLSISDVGEVLIQGVKDADEEKKNFKAWREHAVKLDDVVPWIEKDVREEWGFKAAARAYHISTSGYDVEILGNYRNETPTTIRVGRTRRVPGTPERVRNAFDVSQVLAWLARERNDLQERLEWRQQIPGLMKALVN